MVSRRRWGREAWDIESDSCPRTGPRRIWAATGHRHPDRAVDGRGRRPTGFRTSADLINLPDPGRESRPHPGWRGPPGALRLDRGPRGLIRWTTVDRGSLRGLTSFLQETAGLSVTITL